MQRVRFVDSHTEGEPTRLILDCPPGMPAGTPAEAAAWLDAEARPWMRGVLCEPRGHEAVVGALLMNEGRGIVFFNNIGSLRMCGHGTIGAAATLGFLGMAQRGEKLSFSTPAGEVGAELDQDGCTVAITNVASRLVQKDVKVAAPGFGEVRGDIAWGGNGFFLSSDVPLPLDASHIPELTAYALAVKAGLAESGLDKSHGFLVDHIELVGPPGDPANHARNFVLCPGGEFDRSPCGTGTSAKVACLAASGRLKPGEEWRQESVIGTVFRASYSLNGEEVIPRITGRAWVCAQGELLFEEADPLRNGINYRAV